MLHFLFTGYGGVSPRTQWGRLAALLYALFGIPIILLYLSAMGDGLSSAMRCIFKRIRGTSSKNNSSSSSNSNSSSTPSSSNSNNSANEVNNKNKMIAAENEKRQYNNWNHCSNSIPPPPHLHFNHHNATYNGSFVNNSQPKKQKQSAVPISICIMILICYITFGAAMFHELQQWGVLESLYFCFTSLSTIGFGDLHPKNEVGLYAASAYILIGMAIVAMCFSLIQTELIIWLRKFAVQDQFNQSQDDEVALVTVAMTPVKS